MRIVILGIYYKYYLILVSDPINFETKVHDYFETKLSSEKNYNSVIFLLFKKS